MGGQNKLGGGGWGGWRFFLYLINKGVKINGEGGWNFTKFINFGN